MPFNYSQLTAFIIAAKNSLGFVDSAEAVRTIWNELPENSKNSVKVQFSKERDRDVDLDWPEMLTALYTMGILTIKPVPFLLSLTSESSSIPASTPSPTLMQQSYS